MNNLAIDPVIKVRNVDTVPELTNECSPKSKSSRKKSFFHRKTVAEYEMSYKKRIASE